MCKDEVMKWRLYGKGGYEGTGGTGLDKGRGERRGKGGGGGRQCGNLEKDWFVVFGLS